MRIQVLTRVHIGPYINPNRYAIQMKVAWFIRGFFSVSQVRYVYELFTTSCVSGGAVESDKTNNLWIRPIRSFAGHSHSCEAHKSILKLSQFNKQQKENCNSLSVSRVLFFAIRIKDLMLPKYDTLKDAISSNIWMYTLNVLGAEVSCTPNDTHSP